MKNTDRFRRLAVAADVLCRNEEERYDRTRANLAEARRQAEELSAIGSASGSSTTLLPEVWCARLSRTFAEIARLDEELKGLAHDVHRARVRRDKAEERLRGERTKARLAREAKDVERHVENSYRANRIRLR